MSDTLILFVIVSINLFWMVLFWRLMRAHERIADGVTTYVDELLE